jgi:hypothetical protein
MRIQKVAFLVALAITVPVHAQGGGGGGGAGSGGASASQGSTGGTTSSNPAAGKRSPAQANQIQQNEKKAATRGANTQPTPTGSGTVSAPGVGVGHAANGKPIGMPGSGLGSPGHSEGPTN